MYYGFHRALLGIRPAPVGVLLKKLLRIKRRIADAPAGKFLVDPVSVFGLSLLSEGSYEPDMERTLKAQLGPGKVFVDVGANEGYFSVCGARLTSPNGRVIAIEPQDRAVEIIAKNIELNGISNIEIVRTAISDQEGYDAIYLTPDTNSGGAGLHRATKYRLPIQAVKTATLAQVLDRSGVGFVDLMKIDIEGFEYEAVLGSRPIFQEKRVKALALEMHPMLLASRGRPQQDIEKFLRSAGYAETRQFGNAVWMAS